MITAVIFDLDGVLIDTEETWSEVRAEVVARHGGVWTEADKRNVMGDNSRQWAAYIKNTWRIPLSTEEIFREVLELMKARYARQLRVLPGAADAVAMLAPRYPLAVASSSPRELIGVALQLAGLADCFSIVVSSDEVAHGKPAPDVYLLTAERLGVAPAQCVVIEDSTNGLRAAIAAGMVTIAVPNAAFPPPPTVLTGAAIVLPNLRQLTLDVLVSLSTKTDEHIH